MNRIEFIQYFGTLRRDVPVIASPGLQGGLLAAFADEPMTIYGMDMFCGTPMALGVALGWPDRRVVALAGDGDMLGSLGVLTTVARYQPANLIIIVFDNGAYVTTGSGRARTATATGTNIEQIGRAAGLSKTCTVEDMDAAREALDEAFRTPGPWLIVAKIDQTDREQAVHFSKEAPSVFECGFLFRRAALSSRGLA